MTSAPKADPQTPHTAISVLLVSYVNQHPARQGWVTSDPLVVLARWLCWPTVRLVVALTRLSRRHLRLSRRVVSVFTSPPPQQYQDSVQRPGRAPRLGSHPRPAPHRRSRVHAVGLAPLFLLLLLLALPQHRAQAAGLLAAGKPSASWHEVDRRPMGDTTHVKPPPPPRKIGTWISREKEQTARAEALMSQHRASKVPRI